MYGMMNPSRRVLHDFTVVIPTIGRPILEQCLGSIAKGNVLPPLVIVVDQGENPSVVTWLSSVEVAGMATMHIRSPGRSPASARNQALDQVKTTFVAAIDDDCIADVDWLVKMETRLRQHPMAIITGRLLPAGAGVPPTRVTSEIPYVHLRPSLRIHSPLASANMGFALETARLIGPFDEELKEAEDNDWAYRALRVGIPIVYAPELVVYHFHWRTDAQVRATYRAYGWSQGVFYGKHLRRGDCSMAVRAAITLWRGVRGLVNGVVRNDFALRANALGRLECLLPGIIAGIRGPAGEPARDAGLGAKTGRRSIGR